MITVGQRFRRASTIIAGTPAVHTSATYQVRLAIDPQRPLHHTRYLMLIGKLFRWRPSMLFVVIGAWGVLLALIAWQRYRRAQAASQAPRIPLSSSLAEGLPVVGLLVCLVAHAEYEEEAID